MEETCRRELVIEIPVDVVRREAESVTAEYARLARIPGFRPGHAPSALVRRHFRDGIRSEVVQTLLPKFFDSAVKEQKWSVVGRPEFEDLKFEDNQPLTVKAKFEVYPEFALGDYKGLEVEQEPPAVSDADVDKALEEIRQEAATFEVIEGRAAGADDYVIVNYEGRDLKHPDSKPLEARDAMLNLGGKGTVAAFRDNLRGARAGEKREFDVDYPADYPQKSLAGKTYRYRVEVLSIKQKVVPALDDDLAKSVSELATLGALRDKVRKDVEEHRRRGVEAAARQKLLERLVNAHPIPVPGTLVEAQLNRKLERALLGLMSQGIDPRTTQVDWAKIREDSRPDAEREVRASLVLERIAAREKIDVTEEEVDELVRQLAQQRGETPVALKTRLTRDGELDRMSSTRRSQKALDFVYHNAKITQKNEPAPARAEG